MCENVEVKILKSSKRVKRDKLKKRLQMSNISHET